MIYFCLDLKYPWCLTVINSQFPFEKFPRTTIIDPQMSCNQREYNSKSNLSKLIVDSWPLFYAPFHVLYISALPTLWLSRKVGLRWMQIIAGILPCIGLVGTAFSTQAWHALISNGIITGMIYYRHAWFELHAFKCILQAFIGNIWWIWLILYIVARTIV